MIDPLQLRTVLVTYYSDKDWRFSETAISYEELEWFDTSPKPTPEDVAQKYQEIVDNQWRQEHAAVRATEYPPIEELIIALWEKLVEQDGLTSEKISAIQDKRTEIKEKYPKLTAPRQTPATPEPPLEPDTFA
jgi:hypothetical protein